MSGWVERKFKWLERIAADPSQRGLPLAVAVLLAARYLNFRTRDSWVGVDRLASDLGATRRNTQKAISKLIEAGWLKREIGQGRSYTNRYCMGVADDALNAVKSVADDPKERRRRPVKSVADDALPLRGTREEPGREAADASPADAALSATTSSRGGKRGRKGGSNHGKTEFPQGWVLGDLELAAASLIVPDWTTSKLEVEFTKFRSWNMSKGTKSNNWPAAWLTWCSRGLEYEANHPTQLSPDPLTGIRSDILEGAWSAVNRLKQTKH